MISEIRIILKFLTSFRKRIFFNKYFFEKTTKSENLKIIQEMLRFYEIMRKKSPICFEIPEHILEKTIFFKERELFLKRQFFEIWQN